MMLEKLKTGLWFLQRPSFWAQALELAARKFAADRDTPELAARAEAWARERAVPVGEALARVGLCAQGQPAPALPAPLLAEAKERARASKVVMGGPGDIDLLYAATRLSGARRVVETGVAYGWSSLAMLAALEDAPDARLVSVDMPYPKLGNEQWVGIVVPDELRRNWEIVREPDRNGLVKAIAKLGGTIDLCHYDSDKSYRGREFAFGHIWPALAPSGVFICDDIQDNLAFKDFVEAKGLALAVTEYECKFIGVVRKP
jgi:predicted O-methyltransferase YrrM